MLRQSVSSDSDVRFDISFLSSFFEPPPTPTPLSVVLAVARMSHKYDVPFLRRRALSHLSHRCPTTLQSSLKRCEVDLSIGEELEVLKMALKIDAIWILPFQFFITWLANLDHLLDTQQWKDLELEIQAMCHLKWRRIETHSRICIAELLCKVLSDLCMTCSVLGVQFQNAAVVTLTENIPIVLSPGFNKHASGCCAVCRLKTSQTILNAYDSFWNALPETLGMPQWDILETKKSEDTGANLIKVRFSFLLLTL